MPDLRAPWTAWPKFALSAALLFAVAPLEAQARSLAVCDTAHTAANGAFPLLPASDGWFDVRAVEPGVFALVESRQSQEVISWLIVGTQRALLFDSGLGIKPIRPVVERLTRLPVMVVNSHTHFDHIGGNYEFRDVRAVPGAYTQGHKVGKAHSDLASEVSPTGLCGNTVPGLDTAAFRSRPWQSSTAVRGGDRLSLGGRTIEVLSAPGHTPDALAMFDRSSGLLWTGDTFYAGPIWLFMAETDLSAYGRTIDRLAALTPLVKKVLPAHNVAAVSPALLLSAQRAFHEIQARRATGTKASDDAMSFPFDGFSYLISTRALATLPPERTTR